MKEITIQSANGWERNFAIEDTDTLENLLTSQAVCEWFDAEPHDILEHLEGYDGTEVGESQAVIRAILSAIPDEDAIVEIGLEVKEDDDDDKATGEDAEGTTGFVTVYTNGKLAHTAVQITNGETTVKQAVFNGRVRDVSGMCDAQLSGCPVFRNGQLVDAANLDHVKVHNNDEIVLGPPVANTKGL